MSYDNPYRSAYAPHAAAERKESGLGIASFLIGLISAVAEVGMIAMAVMLAASGVVDEQSPQTILVGLGILGGLALAVLGLLMGIVALLDKRRSKVFALLGVLCSGMVLASVALLLILGAVLG
jgi:hypothetical protein